MFTLDKKELFNLPRIALIHGDGDYNKWKDPIKKSFEIPETMFADVHASRVKEDFLDKRVQFLLCIISPRYSVQGGIDFGAYVDLWLDYLNQGSILMVFDTDVAWLGQLGRRFAVSSREAGSEGAVVSKPRRICLESRLLANQGFAEGVENLGPWLGEFASWDPCWEPLIESEDGGALALAQSFGMSKIILFAGLLSKDNLIKIIPVRMIIASALETWFRETSLSSYDAQAGIHCSILLNRKVHARFLPLESTICIGSTGSRKLNGTINVEFHVKKGDELIYKLQDPAKELKGKENWAMNLSINLDTINDGSIEDGDYVLKFSIHFIDENKKYVHFSDEIEFSINTKEISEIWSNLYGLRQAVSRELKEMGNYPDEQAPEGIMKALPARIDEVSKGMQLVYLHSRVGIGLEILENVLGMAVDPSTPLKVIGKITKPIHVNIGTMDELRRVFQECCARATLLPSFSPLPVANDRYRLLQAMASGPGSGCVWECKPVSGASSIIQGFGNKKPEESIAAFYNGFCVARAACIVEGKKEKLQKHRDAFKKQFPVHEVVGELDLTIARSDAFRQVSWHGFISKGDFAIRVNAPSRQGILTIAEHAISETPITKHEVRVMALNAWDGLTLDGGLDIKSFLSHVRGSSLILPGAGKVTDDALKAAMSALGISEVYHDRPSSDRASNRTTWLHFCEGNGCRAEIKARGEQRELHIRFGNELGLNAPEAITFLSILDKYIRGDWTYFIGDLHSHSTLSDGMFNPEDVGISAFNCFMDFFGLTDHHTIAGSNYLCTVAKARGWDALFIPGCQEVTQLNAHYIAVCSKKTVFELVEPEEIIGEFAKAGANLKIFAHPRQPHPWNDRTIKLGSKSGFDSFVGRGEFLAYREAFVKDGNEPAWTESTDADDACFGSPQRTVVLVDTKTSQAASICNIVCNAIKQKQCFGMTGSGFFGTPAIELFARILPTLDITSKTFNDRFAKRVRGFVRGS